MSPAFPRAVLFDLLTALLDSWSVWNAAAGSEERGRAWRAQYLRLTYGCGPYVPYEDLVREAASLSGLGESAPRELDRLWLDLRPWSGVQETLDALAGRCKLAVVTNCSVRLGEAAAERLDVRWDCVMTAEEAGYYKPNPRPYQMALARLGVDARDAAFVAGSAFDLVGTSAVGLRTYWHNRVGLARPPEVPAPSREEKTFAGLISWLERKS